MRRQFLEACRDCAATQREALRRILTLNAGSQFSRDYRLAPEMSVEEFRRSFPISEYERFAPYIDRIRAGETSALLGPENELLMFALSSGTTTESKYIPVTRPFLNDYRRGWKIWGIGAIDRHPGVDRGHIFQITSSQNRFTTEAGTPCGNISGLVTSMQSKLLRSMYTLPKTVAGIKDPEGKYYAIIRLAMADQSLTWINTANPGTLVKLAGLMNEHAQRLIEDVRAGTFSSPYPLTDEEIRTLQTRYARPNPARANFLQQQLDRAGALLPKDVWPRLQLLGIWTGGSAGAYLPTIRSFYGEADIQDHGLHASEGRMTIPLEGDTSSGVLDITSHFFEFISEAEADRDDLTDTETLLAHELRVGENYYILMTTTSGLYRYNIRDVVRCTGFEGTAPILEFLHKGAHISNVTGEKLTESHVVTAVRTAAEDVGVDVPQFSVIPVWGDPPEYRLLLQQNDADSENLNRLAGAVDRQLLALNCEYREKRESGRLGELAGQLVGEGTWENLAKSRNQRKGSSLEQYKHPCLIPDLEFINQLPDLEARSASLAR
jgi:hypothetical protein